jgi:hypothetical protein
LRPDIEEKCDILARAIDKDFLFNYGSIRIKED